MSDHARYYMEQQEDDEAAPSDAWPSAMVCDSCDTVGHGTLAGDVFECYDCTWKRWLDEGRAVEMFPDRDLPF